MCFRNKRAELWVQKEGKEKERLKGGQFFSFFIFLFFALCSFALACGGSLAILIWKVQFSLFDCTKQKCTLVIVATAHLLTVKGRSLSPCGMSTLASLFYN